MITYEPNPRFASPAFLVKETDESYRLVIDLRNLNDSVEDALNILPHCDMQLQWLGSNKKWFGSYDVLKCFDYLAVEVEAQDLFCFSTLWGAFKLRGDPQGIKITPTVFTERVIREALGGGKREGLFGGLQWIDDSLLYADTFDGFLEATRKLLQACIAKKLRLNFQVHILF